MQQQSRRPSPASLRGITRTTRESQKEQSTTRAWPEPRWREPRRRVQRPGGGAKGGERARLRTLRRGRGEGDVEAAAVPDASLHASAAAGGGLLLGGGRGRTTEAEGEGGRRERAEGRVVAALASCSVSRIRERDESRIGT